MSHSVEELIDEAPQFGGLTLIEVSNGDSVKKGIQVWRQRAYFSSYGVDEELLAAGLVTIRSGQRRLKGIEFMLRLPGYDEPLLNDVLPYAKDSSGRHKVQAFAKELGWTPAKILSAEHDTARWINHLWTQRYGTSFEQEIGTIKGQCLELYVSRLFERQFEERCISGRIYTNIAIPKPDNLWLDDPGRAMREIDIAMLASSSDVRAALRGIQREQRGQGSYLRRWGRHISRLEAP